MTSLHSTVTAKGETLSLLLDGPASYEITFLGSALRQPWTLHETVGIDTVRWVGTFRTREGAEFFALHLEAEKAG